MEKVYRYNEGLHASILMDFFSSIEELRLSHKDSSGHSIFLIQGWGCLSHALWMEASAIKLTECNSKTFNSNKIPGDQKEIRTKDTCMIERMLYLLTH